MATAVPKRILVVEDDPDSREMLATALRGQGYSVALAEDGQSGLEAIRAEQPDLIITDFLMPRLDGLDMIRLIREKLNYDPIPIVVITAAYGEVLTDAMEAGADAATYKPVQLRALFDLIRRLLAALTVLPTIFPDIL